MCTGSNGTSTRHQVCGSPLYHTLKCARVFVVRLCNTGMCPIKVVPGTRYRVPGTNDSLLHFLKSQTGIIIDAGNSLTQVDISSNGKKLSTPLATSQSRAAAKKSLRSRMDEEKKSEVGFAARLARRNILELKPYRCARDDYHEGVLLDANENALGPTSVPNNSMDPYDNHLSLERYPDPYQLALKKKYAAYRGNGLTPQNIFCGVGSDEAIDLLIRIFCAPGRDNILTAPPTYGMYKVCANVNDVEILACPLTPDFDLRIPEVC